MQEFIQIDAQTRRMLLEETSIHEREIRALYGRLDRQFALRGAQIPIEFDFAQDSLGAYSTGHDGDGEEFRFSLLFIGYAVKKPLSKEDRIDLYLHEYAHYMQYNMPIPKKYDFSPGIHGSAWKYCCSLVGAAPTQYYRAGEGLMEHQYEKVLVSKSKDKTIPFRDIYQREKAGRQEKDREVRYHVSESVIHPKFGEGIVEQVEQTAVSVRLTVRFNDATRKLDQKWLVRRSMS